MGAPASSSPVVVCYLQGNRHVLRAEAWSNPVLRSIDGAAQASRASATSAGVDDHRVAERGDAAAADALRAHSGGGRPHRSDLLPVKRRFDGSTATAK